MKSNSVFNKSSITHKELEGIITKKRGKAISQLAVATNYLDNAEDCFAIDIAIYAYNEADLALRNSVALANYIDTLPRTNTAQQVSTITDKLKQLIGKVRVKK